LAGERERDDCCIFVFKNKENPPAVLTNRAEKVDADLDHVETAILLSALPHQALRDAHSALDHDRDDEVEHCHDGHERREAEHVEVPQTRHGEDNGKAREHDNCAIDLGKYEFHY